MNFFKNILAKKKNAHDPYENFWDWFKKNESIFHKAVSQHRSIQEQFFTRLIPQLALVKEGIYFLTGMSDQNTAELILTADGRIANIVFVEELVAAAPLIDGWKFTALKPELDVADVNIEMEGIRFTGENIFFYAELDEDFPDEISLAIFHNGYERYMDKNISNGTGIFLDNMLGELNFALVVDDIKLITRDEITQDLIPVTKLKEYLNWRQKEFVEKYEGVRRVSEHDTYSILEATIANEWPSVAMINTDLMAWDAKPSHPWLLVVRFKFDGNKLNGMPDDNTSTAMNLLEEEIIYQLHDEECYLNVGRETGTNQREIYFACRDFRKPSKIICALQKQDDSRIKIEYEIFKDKYWRLLERFT